MSEQKHEVKHDEANSQYIIEVDGATAGTCAYVDNGEVRDFNHTVVGEEFQGQGLSKPLIKAALDDTREAGKKIRTTCSAVERFVGKNEDYQDLVA